MCLGSSATSLKRGGTQHTFPAEVELGNAPPSVSAPKLETDVLFAVSLGPPSACLCLLLEISLFNTVPVYSGEVLSTLPKCKKAVIHPVEKTQFRSVSFRGKL